MKRQLAAILYADVAGYSRLTGQNEEQTHQMLSEALTLLTDTITACGGSKVHEAGDAILAEFPSVTEAVDSAFEFQKSMVNWKLELTENERLLFRIGIHIGEVMRDRGDIYGDGVNIAARIEEIAQPGSLCVSSAVVEQLATDSRYNFDDLGYRHFKNIDRPVHVYQLRSSDLLGGNPLQDISRRVEHMPLFDDAIVKTLVTTGRCVCGSNRFEVTQEALGTGFCHCRICQRSTGAPAFAWTAFPLEAVKFTREKLKYHRVSLIAEQGFCENCGSPLVWKSLKPKPAKYIVIPTTSLENPEDYAPTWHQGVESQLSWFEIQDDLPRTRCEESPMLRDAWSSMGAPDPDDWKALDYEAAEQLDDDAKLS
jgi:class 3 adenylate cyclase